MNFSDKLINLRKQRGWSQEELANKLDVTRQSVSKWESMSSVPDLDKVIKISEIFDVRTDYLLKDTEATEPENASSESQSDKSISLHKVSADEAESYLTQVKSGAGKTALGISICIISCVPLLILDGISTLNTGGIAENVATGIGVGILLLLVAVGAVLIVMENAKLRPYEYLDREPISADKDVISRTRNRKENYEPSRRRYLVCGIALCIIAAIPLIVTNSLFNKTEFLILTMVALLLVLVSTGVFLLVKSGIICEGFDKILEEGEYTRANKSIIKQKEIFATIYWCIVTAVYLAWSFITSQWDTSWIVWPVAGVLYGAIITIVLNFKKN